MRTPVRLGDLETMHPQLLWEDICAAGLVILGKKEIASPFALAMDVLDVPGYGSGIMELLIDCTGIVSSHVARLQRTFESSRLVELAAIAMAGLSLYQAGGHEIRDVALRGSAADYLVDEANYLLEIAGRSRRMDFEAAWQQRWQKLAKLQTGGFFLCVVEFETPRGRLAFSV